MKHLLLAANGIGAFSLIILTVGAAQAALRAVGIMG